MCGSEGPVVDPVWSNDAAGLAILYELRTTMRIVRVVADEWNNWTTLVFSHTPRRMLADLRVLANKYQQSTQDQRRRGD